MKFLKKNYYTITIISIFLFAFALRLYHIDFLNLWRDEAFTVNAANKTLSELLEIMIKDTQAPLHTIVLHYWVKIFGHSEFSVRFVSLLFGMMTVYYCFRISKYIFQKKKYILISTLIATVSPLLIVYSQEARAYSMLTAFCCCAIFYSLKLNEHSSLSNYILFILFSVLGLYVHNIFIVVLVSILCLFVFLLAKKNKFNILRILKDKFFHKIIVTFVIIFVLFFPWLFIFLQQLNRVNIGGFWLKFDPLKDLINNTSWFFTSQSYSLDLPGMDPFFIFYINTFGLAVGFVGILNEIRNYKNAFPKISFFIILMLSIVFLISFKIPFYYIRYLIFVVPLIFIILTKGITQLPKIFGEKVTNALVIIFIFSCTTLYLTDIAQNPGLKANTKDAITSMVFDQKTDLILHPHVATFHSFYYYSDLQSYIYDPNRDLAYYEGLAIVTENDYYDSDITIFKRIWVFNLWKDDEFEKELINYGFYKSNTKWFPGNLTVDLWINSKTS